MAWSINSRKPHNGRWNTLATACAIALGTAIGLWAQQVASILLAATSVGVLLALRRRLAPSLLSPVWITVGSYLLLAAAGLAFYRPLADSGASGASITISLTDTAEFATARLILVAATAIATGAALCSLFALTQPERAQLHPIDLTERTQRWLIAASAALVMLMTVSFGWRELMHRSFYGQISTPRVYSLATHLAVVAVLALGHLVVASRGGRRLVVLLLVACFALVWFCTSSRQLALLPLLFTLGVLAAAPQSRQGRMMLLIAGIAGLALVRVSLYTRSLPSHGLWPYLDGLGGLLATPGGWRPVAVNILVGFGLIAKTATDAPHIPPDHLLIALNPLPGGVSGWYEIAGQHRLNQFTPYAALGELANHGWAVLIGYCTVVGFIFAYFDRRMRALLAHGQQLFGLALLGMAAVFVVLSTQYNLRSVTRMLYYALALDLGIRVLLAGRVGPHESANTDNLPQSN